MATTENQMTLPLKLLYLVELLGEYGTVPDGAIVSIGGVVGPNFTVDGRPLLFADGTATDGSATPFTRPNFQTIYENTAGEFFVDFVSNKDFVLQAVNDKQFRFDADTGDVTILGNLVVLGETTVINTSLSTDRVEIHQTTGNYIPFIMEPIGGVTPDVNVVDIKVARSGASVFTIGPTGETFIQSLNTGLVNGVDIVQLAADLYNHISIPEGIKHSAAQIVVDTSELEVVTGDTVQAAIESIDQAVRAISYPQIGDVRGYEHIQETPSRTWVVAHNQNTKRIQLTIWDETDDQILADVTHVFDANSLIIKFGSPISGRAILMLFGGGNVAP